MKDPLGDRMKAYYEERTRVYLPRRSYVVLRLDGKAFHTYTKGLDKPFDSDLVRHMAETTAFLCKNIQGAKIGYVQSDEITIVLTDFDTLKTDAWFDYNVQKMTSISASMCTAKFNELRPGKLAYFDSRVFTVPNMTEVINCLLWRQQDAVRNSKSMLAQSVFSHKELHKKTTNEMEHMLYERGHVWADLPEAYKQGTFIIKGTEVRNGTERSVWKPATDVPMLSTNDGVAFVRSVVPDRDR